MIPGLIDCHTHPVFAEPRLVDFEKRIAGAGYEEIAAAGGGIRSSVAAVRKASRGELSKKVLTALNAMLEQGTSVVEAKSGYGLTLEDEIKSLEAIRDAARQWPGEVVSTLAGGARGAAGICRQSRRLCEEGLRRDDSAGRQKETGEVC